MNERIGRQDAPGAPAQLVGNPPLRDGEQPRPHRSRRRASRERDGGVQERLLRHLLGVGSVVQPTENERVDVAAEPRERVVESR